MIFLASSSTRFVELQKMIDWLIMSWADRQRSSRLTAMWLTLEKRVFRQFTFCLSSINA